MYFLKVYRDMKNGIIILAVMALLGGTGVAEAALHDRGGGLLYDDVLKVTWLQDANYAKTTGKTPQGCMDFAAANKWVKELVYHDTVRNVDWKGWRLPKVKPVGATFSGRFSVSGNSDEGYNITSPNSELAYMFYVNLGLKAYYLPSGETREDFGAAGNGKFDQVVNVGLVKNLRSTVYWTGTPCPPFFNAWMFNAHTGCQNYFNQWDVLCVWAVRDGDVADPAQLPKP